MASDAFANGGLATNYFPNSSLAGAVAGTPGTLPTGITIFNNSTGFVSSVVGTGSDANGLPYVDVSFSGTSTGANVCGFTIGSTGTMPGVQSQTWTFTNWMQITAGSFPAGLVTWDGSIELTTGLVGSGGGSQPIVTNPNSTTATRYILTRANSSATTAFVGQQIKFNLFFSSTYAFTIRLSGIQCEISKFSTPFISTNGAAASTVLTDPAIAAEIATASGTAVVSGVSASQSLVTASGSGSSTAPAISASTDTSTTTTIGTSTASGVSASFATGTASASGAGSAAAISANLGNAVATAIGTGSASGISASLTSSLATATGAGSATATSASLAITAATATGSGTANANGTGAVFATANAAGSSTATATGGSQARANGTASGNATTNFVGGAIVLVVGVAAGSCTVVAAGRASTDVNGLASGTCFVIATGYPLGSGANTHVFVATTIGTSRAAATIGTNRAAATIGTIRSVKIA